MEKISRRKDLTYANVPKDYDGWVDATKYMPVDYDLCSLKIKDKKSISGWCIGLVWDGLRLRKNDEILYWKVKKEPKGESHASS